MKRSTRAFLREARKKDGYSFYDWLHGYVYMRWPYLYIGIGKGMHPLSRMVYLMRRLISKYVPGKTKHNDTFAEGYHGKVVTADEAGRLVHIDQDIDIRNLEQIIPYTRAKDIIIKNPQHIVVLDCPCRSAMHKPCEPLDVCLIIGDPFAGFISEHHPQRSRRITAQEAVEIINAEHRRGHVQHAFFKDAMLGRFYAICNCCSCCCGAMQAHRQDVPMLAASGYVCRVEGERCVACGTCVEYCPFDALKLSDDALIVDDERCMGCGICVSCCEHDAHTLERDGRKGIPLHISELMPAE
ncbi:MAG: 4Fe-4S ferredoxin [Caldithrix sp.]|nr:4Fe-4S ferredoxin [Caldithrix sp.]